MRRFTPSPAIVSVVVSRKLISIPFTSSLLNLFLSLPPFTPFFVTWFGLKLNRKSWKWERDWLTDLIHATKDPSFTSFLSVSYRQKHTHNTTHTFRIRDVFQADSKQQSELLHRKNLTLVHQSTLFSFKHFVRRTKQGREEGMRLRRCL